MPYRPRWARPPGAATLALLLFVLWTPPGQAQAAPTLTFGLGVDDIADRHSPAAGGLVEYASAPWGRRGLARTRAGLMLSGDLDLWIGVGLSQEVPLGRRWFAEVSVMPGVMVRGDVRPGDDEVIFPQFRSMLAVGRRSASGAVWSLSFSHRSNGGLDDEGSSSEEVLLRYTVPLGP